MTTITEKLAEALRGLLDAPSACDCGPQGCGVAECRTDQREAIETAARTTLAEYEDHRAAPRVGDRLRITVEGFGKNVGDLVSVCAAPEAYLDADGNDRNGFIWALQEGGLYAGSRICLSPTLGGYTLERIA